MLTCLLISLLVSFNLPAQTVQDSVVNFDKIFGKYDAEGCAVIYNLDSDRYLRYNLEDCDSGYLPASTFKIPNTLIFLETGIVKDINHQLKWDGKNRGIKSWNKDHTLETAFRNSAVWYYEEITKQLGLGKEKEFLEKLNYGNQKVNGNFPFWLKGDLRISANQQVDFLKKLYTNDLPFNEEYLSTVKDLMILEQDSTYTLRGKTGWARPENREVGWLVGYLETDEDVFVYAVNVRAERGNKMFRKARLEIAREIFRELGIVQ